MNVALPSTYRFMEKVIQELNAMYQGSWSFHWHSAFGGDEVPRGVWMGSPKCQELMKEKGMTKAHDLSEYFITQMADVMQKNGTEIQWLAGSCFGAYRRGASTVEGPGCRCVLLEYGTGLR